LGRPSRTGYTARRLGTRLRWEAVAATGDTGVAARQNVTKRLEGPDARPAHVVMNDDGEYEDRHHPHRLPREAYQQLWQPVSFIVCTARRPGASILE